MALGAGTAQGEPGKLDGNGRLGVADQRLLAAEAAAGKAASLANPAVNVALASIQPRIADFVRTTGTRHAFGTFVDPVTSKIVIETDAPAAVLSPLVGTSAGLVEVRSGTATGTFHRRDDIDPYWGGAGVTASVGVASCSTGFTVQNGVGTRFMVTAGHCFSNGTNVVTELGGRAMGSVSGNGLPSQDMELIGGQSYGASIYVGGVTSSTGNPVVAAADPLVSFSQYCHSGRTTGENCGHTAISVTAQVCTSSGCKSPVIAWTGGAMLQGGDSGSPFYAKSGTNIHIRGINIAVNNSTGTSYSEMWSRIAGRFGVSIVT